MSAGQTAHIRDGWPPANTPEMAAQLTSIVSAKAPGAKMVTTAQFLTVT